MNKIQKRWMVSSFFIVAVISLFLGIWRMRPPDQPLEQTKKTQDTIMVTDSIGRQVAIPAKVDRIACLYAFSGHVVTMLGKSTNIVAVVDGLKRDVLLTEMSPGIKTALVPVTSGTINIEELLKARPDIAFISGDTAKNEGEVEKLRKSKIPYLVVDYRNIKEQQYAIQMIGQAVGAEEKAQRYNAYYQSCIDAVQAKVKDIPLEERVKVYHSVNEATRTDVKDTLPADWIQVAGAFNVSVNENLRVVDGNKYIASLEQILVWNPQVILVNEAGVADYIMGNSQWSKINAVEHGKVYQMPNGISRWGHPGSLETPLAVLWTAKTLYPDRFPDLDMAKEAKNFYQEFFNYPLSDEAVAQVLSGKGMRIPKHE